MFVTIVTVPLTIVLTAAFIYKLRRSLFLHDIYYYIRTKLLRDIMGKLSELFSRQEGYSVDPEKRRIDDELLNDHMDQGWRQKYIAPESYLNPSPSSSSVCMFGDGPSSQDSRPRKRKATEGLFGNIYQYFQTYDVDYRRCHGDGSRGGAIILSSKRRAVNNDHSYYASLTEVPDELTVPRSRGNSLPTFRRARKSVRRAVRTLNSSRR